MIRVLVADDDPLVRLGLRELLLSADDITVAGEAEDGVRAVELVRTRGVDVVLMDLRMPRLDGLRATAQVLALPHPPRVLVLTTFDGDTHVLAALRAGACGFLVKDTPPTRILEAVRTVHAGEGVLHPRAASVVVDRIRSGEAAQALAARAAVDRLTPREVDVLRRLATGESNQAIAAALAMRESTVKAHVTRIMATLGVDNRVRAALVARDAGL